MSSAGSQQQETALKNVPVLGNVLPGHGTHAEMRSQKTNRGRVQRGCDTHGPTPDRGI